MPELFLDLSNDATRTHIYRTVLGRLSDQDRLKVEQAVSGLELSKHHYHDVAAVTEAIDSLSVSERVKNDVRSIYHLLAQAEAEVHGCDIGQTHFHEVGITEAIRNTVGICLAIEAFGPDRIVASCVQTGRGTVDCSHGVLDIPAPATAAILGRGIPLCEKRYDGELCTPTSAAIIAHFVDEFLLP